MIGAVALLLLTSGVVALYGAVTNQNPLSEAKAALSGGANPAEPIDRTTPEYRAGQEEQADRLGGGRIANAGVAAPGTAGMVPAFAQRVSALVFASGGRVTITSGARTRDQQAKLYAKYLAGGNLAAKPGTSKHEAGLAVDFGGDLALAERLAPAFGLRQTVPGERWHFE